MNTVLRIVLLSLICTSLLTQNSLTRALASDQNSILNFYDAFGYQKRGTLKCTPNWKQCSTWNVCTSFL